MNASAGTFGRIEIRPATRQLLVEGKPVAVGARAFDVLVALVERRERLVTKQELLDVAWSGAAVEENNLAVQISTLRKLLGQDLIVTVPGRGYRFAAPQAAAGPAADAAPAPGPDAPRLPRAVLPIYGRGEELEQLAAVLAGHRFVTLAGLGGVGKSHLAQHVLRRQAPRHEHGAAWVELAQLSARELVIGTVAAAVGAPLGGVDPLADLVAALRGRELLLGLDNAEHLLDEVGRVAEAVVAGAPRVTLLVTSQAPLRLAQERVMRLAPLSLPPPGATPDEAMRHGAMELFVRRAQETDLRFELHAQNVAAAVEVCRRVDGLPLALELAAARTPLLRLAGLTALLSDPLRLLAAAGKRSLDPRHRALRITLEWSHGLLCAREKTAFRRLAAFVGSCSIELACEVLPDVGGRAGEGAIADRWAALDALNELVERSLVEADGNDPPRYRLLETSRAFALERLAEAGEADALRARHARAVAAAFVRADEAITAGALSRDQAVESLWPEIDNARAALAWSLGHDPSLALALVPVVDDLFKSIIFAEVRRMWEATLPLLHDGLPPGLRARWALGYAHFWSNRDLALALNWTDLAVALYDGLDDPPRLLRALYLRAGAKARSGLDTAGDLARIRAIDCSRAPPGVRFNQQFAEAVVAALQGDFDAAIVHYERARPLAAQMGDRERHDVLLLNLIDMEMAMGRLDDAIRHGEELVARLRGSRFLELMAIALHNLAAAFIARGSLAQARKVIAQGLSLATDHSLTAEWADHLALLAVQEGRPRDAARLLGYGDARYEERGSTRTTNEAAAAARAESLARAACGDAAFEAERRRGRGATEPEVPVLGLGLGLGSGEDDAGSGEIARILK